MTDPTCPAHANGDGDGDDIGAMVERTRTFARKIRKKPRRKQTRIKATCLLALFALLGVTLMGIRNSPIEGENVPVGKTMKLRGKKAWISEHSQPFNQEHRASTAHHLIMVAGHSVIVSGDLEDADEDENDWWLLDYQRHQGLPQAIRGHIQAGIEEADRDPDSLLIFSGGETRAMTGPMAESSYFHVADAMEMWPKGSTVRARTTAEEFATDSFENLLFSICRFKEVTGSYPTKDNNSVFFIQTKTIRVAPRPGTTIPKRGL